MRKIKIFDTTLRDGEQAVGVSLNPYEKLEIAKQLRDLNVDIIEAGFPISNEEDYVASKIIAKEIHGSTICALARVVRGDIDRAYDAVKYSSNPRIHTFVATSQIHRDKKLRKSPEEVLEMIYNGVSYAKSMGVEVEFSPEDASRTEFNYMIKSIGMAIEAGARVINIPDTVGDSIPFEFYDRIKRVYDTFPGFGNGNLELSVHCHNDKGNAVANSIAGVMAGASQVECVVNGIGERTGNAALEEVVMNIETKRDYLNARTGIYTPSLYETCRVVSNLTGVPIPKNKPIVGTHAFSHESGIHQHGVLKDPNTYETISPDDVGWTGERIVFGKHSGRHAREYIEIKSNLNEVN